MRKVASVLVGSLVLVTAGCGDDSDSPDDHPTGLGDDYSVAGALAEIPADVDRQSLLLSTADLDEATELADVDRPGNPDAEEVSTWLSAITGAAEDPTPVFVPLGPPFDNGGIDQGEVDEKYGWSLLDVSSYVASDTPPDTIMVVHGDFGADTLSDDLIDVDQGIVSDLEGDDQVTYVGNATPLDQLGRPTRLAAEDGMIALSPSTPLVQSWLDDDESLADDAELSAVAEALDDEGIYSAVIRPVDEGGLPALGGSQASPEQQLMLEDRYGDLLPEESFSTVGIGWTVEDDEAHAHVAYHFGSAEAAEQGAEDLEELYADGDTMQGVPISEMMEVEDATADGEVAVVTVKLDRPSTPYQMLMQGDLPFISR